MLKTFCNVNKHMWYKKYLWLNLGYLGITRKFQNVLKYNQIDDKWATNFPSSHRLINYLVGQQP